MRERIKSMVGKLSVQQRKWLKRGLGIAAGAGLGFGYYITVGCSTGGCPITSDPWISAAWGALIGGTATA